MRCKMPIGIMAVCALRRGSFVRYAGDPEDGAVEEEMFYQPEWICGICGFGDAVVAGRFTGC